AEHRGRAAILTHGDGIGQAESAPVPHCRMPSDHTSTRAVARSCLSLLASLFDRASATCPADRTISGGRQSGAGFGQLVHLTGCPDARVAGSRVAPKFGTGPFGHRRSAALAALV